MNQQPGLLHPSLPCSGSMQAIKRPVAARKRGLTTSSGEAPTEVGRLRMTQKNQSLDVTLEKKHSGNQEEIVWPSKNIFEAESQWWVRSGSPSPSCILELILVWTVLDVSYLLWTSEMPCRKASGSWDKHSVTSPGSPDRGHGVGSAKLGEGPKQGSQLKSLEILQQNKSTPTNETNEETNFKSMQIQVRRIHSKKGLRELFDLEWL